MKHLKPYQLFESNAVLIAGIENAIRNDNKELYHQIIDQYGDTIDYSDVVDVIFEHSASQFRSFVGPKDHDQHKDKPVSGVTTHNKRLNKGMTFEFLEFIPNKFIYDIIDVNCYKKNLKSLKGIEYLTGLERLVCNENQITSLEPLRNLKYLEAIACDNNLITSLEPIFKPHLLNFQACRNKLTSLKGIEIVEDLKSFKASGNDFSPEIQRIINIRMDQFSDIELIQNTYRNN